MKSTKRDPPMLPQKEVTWQRRFYKSDSNLIELGYSKGFLKLAALITQMWISSEAFWVSTKHFFV
jgi:hypothetical protein